MRRLLLGLTLAALLALSIGVGVLVAYWPVLSESYGSGEGASAVDGP